MMRWALIATAGCVLLIAVMAATRNMGRPQASPAEVAEPQVAAAAAAPPVAKAPEPEPALATAPAQDLSVDQQAEDDAAAAGMTTREPAGEAEAPAPPS